MTKKYISHVKSLFALGGPLILGQVAHMSIGITDTVMLGWYSVEALAGVSWVIHFSFLSLSLA